MAKRRLSELREKVGRLSTSASGSKITFAELASKWLETHRVSLKPSSGRRKETSIHQLKKHFGTVAVRNINAALADNWVRNRSPQIKASTYNNERETLRAILEYARRDGLILDNPATHLPRRKLGKPAIVIPSHEQFRSLIKAIRTLDRRAWDSADLVELLAYSGMRLAEATALMWKDVDFERETFTITGGEAGTKNYEARTVPLFPAMKELLLRLKSSSSPKGDETIAKIGTAKKAIVSACKDAKLPHYLHHTMRHFFVSNAIEAGIDFKVIASWVGHKDGGVLVAKTYGHPAFYKFVSCNIRRLSRPPLSKVPLNRGCRSSV